MDASSMTAAAGAAEAEATAQAAPDAHVLIIGAGFSGLGMAHALRRQGVSDIRIVEAAGGIGGTWWWNAYPGAACDIRSHLYSFSWAPKPDWSRSYAPQPEIRAYLEEVADRFDLRRLIAFGREVRALRWDEDAGLWRVEFADGAALRARHVVNGGGALHRPKIPDIPGLSDFAGPVMHTARWDREVEIAGRRVAVIGSAASAVQAVPRLAETAAHVAVFQRTPSWIAPRGDFSYSPRWKRLFRAVPALARLHRWLIFMRQETLVFPIVVDAKARRRAAALVRRAMRRAVADPELREKITPDHELGCKRILLSDDYLPALQRANVTLVASGAARVEAGAVIDAGGARHGADVIVLATGFDLPGHMTAIETVGREGRRLADLWRDHASAWRGVMIPGFPNYYMTTGPNTGLGTNSIVAMIEAAAGWIAPTIARTGAGAVEPTEEAFAAFNRELAAALSRTVWATGCRSWYKRADGTNDILYPGHVRAFRAMLRAPHEDELRVRAPR